MSIRLRLTLLYSAILALTLVAQTALGAARTLKDPTAREAALRRLIQQKAASASPGEKAEALGLPKSSERKPAVPKRRASTADFWGDLVGPVSAISARAGYVPMARAMEWSSPVVGEIVRVPAPLSATEDTAAAPEHEPHVGGALEPLRRHWLAVTVPASSSTFSLTRSP